jgi:hypothetical protein
MDMVVVSGGGRGLRRGDKSTSDDTRDDELKNGERDVLGRPTSLRDRQYVG